MNSVLFLRLVSCLFVITLIVAAEQDPVSAASASLKLKKTFLIDAVHSDHSLIKDELLARGWQEARKKSSTTDFLWTFSKRPHLTATSKQIINHFPNFEQMGTKIGLWYNLCQRPERRLDQDGSLAASSFLPRSYLLVKSQAQEEQEQIFISADEANSQKLDFISDFQRTALHSKSKGMCVHNFFI